MRISAHAAAGGDELFLKLPGVPGESVKPGFTNQIDLVSFSWGMSAPPGGKANLSSLSLQAQLDRSFPALESAIGNGRIFPTAQLTLTEDGTSPGTRFTALKMILGHVHVDSASIGGAVGGGQPSVSITLSYSQEETDYQSNTGVTAHSCWDVVNNNATCPPPPGP